MSGKMANKIKFNPNWRSRNTTISTKSYKYDTAWSTYQRWVSAAYQPESLDSMLPARPALKTRTWLQVLNYSWPWVLSVQVSAREKSKSSSPTRIREEAERGKCTEKRRRKNTLNGKNSHQIQSTSSFSDDAVERNWAQQILSGEAE